MSNVDYSQFYQFLAKFQGEGKNWNDVADQQYGDSDGTILLSEFRAFCKGEWTGTSTLSDDLIDDFWGKIDTNRSSAKMTGTKWRNKNALDNNEMAALERKLEGYAELNTFIQQNVEIPSVLTSTGNQWKSDVIDELTKAFDKFCESGNTGDISEMLAEILPGIENKCTAQCFAAEYQDKLRNSLLSEYPDYKVGDDPTLQSLINKFIETIDADANLLDITEDLRDIMDAYFATAELGNGSDYDLSTLGYNSNTLNGIQIAVITQKIKTALADEAKNYAGYEEEFNAAVQSFIEDQIKSGKDFETLKDSAGDFANSKYKQNLDNSIYIDKTYGDITAEENKSLKTFYQKLVDTFGEYIAQKIAQNDKYVSEYQSIIADVKAKVASGELSMNEVEDYIIQQLSGCIDKFMSNGLGDLKISELNNVYKKLAESAESLPDASQGLAQHRNAAISYCTALAAKGDKYANLVTQVFGSDYKTTINNMLPGDITDAMKTLMEKATKLGDPISSDPDNVTWPNLKDQSLKTGKTLELDAKASIKDSNGNAIDIGRITYSVSSNGNGSATINPQTGKITIQAGDTEGYINVSVTAYVDGMPVGDAKTFTVTVTPSAKPISDTKIAELKAKQTNHVNLTAWAQGQSTSAATHLNTAKVQAQGRVADCVAVAKTTLLISMNSALDATALNKAAASLKDYYVNLIGVLTDSTESGGWGEHTNEATFSYTDVNGEAKTESTTYTQQVRGDQGNHTTSDTVSGVTLHECTAGKNSYFIAINMQVVMQKLIEFYNAAI